MKVLLCERSVIGHRAIYMQRLSQIEGIEFFCYAPENVGLPEDHFIQLSDSGKPGSFGEYLRWINQIRRITRENNIDIVHFLDGDTIMKFFGTGFMRISAKKIIITYHHFFEGLMRKISYKMMNAKKHSISVAHTDSVKKALLSCGIKNVETCRYPAFDFETIAALDTTECKKELNVPSNVPTIGIIGGVCDYKRIPEFLETISSVEDDFCILLGGNTSEEAKAKIEKATASYHEKIVFYPRRLSADEYQMAIAASDIIYSLYGTDFDGASGPLNDGVCAGKMILSCSHGSLGQITIQNHLGYTADCNNPEEILEQTQNALKSVADFKYDEIANEYRESLGPHYFHTRYREIYDLFCC